MTRMKIRGYENQSRGRKNGLHIWPVAQDARLSGWGRAFLFGLACCLAMLAWGCGKGAVDPATQTTGTGTSQTSAQLTVSTNTASFGNVTVNTTATQSLTVTSTGTAPVTINSGAMTGAGFTIVGQTFPVTLNPTQSLTIQLQFAPTAAGAVTGQLTISSNSSTGSTALVALSGTGTTASSGGQPTLTISSANVNFGSTVVNTPVTQSLTLTSTGTSAVTINSGAMTGAGFSIVAQTFPVTLSPGQSLTIQLQFDPTTAGALSGQLTISSNSSTGSTALVALSGTGTTASSGQATLTIGAANVNFGSTVVNTPVTQSLVLTSTGTAAVTINSGTIAGTGFAILGGSFPVTLNPNQTLTLQLQFDPTTAGALSGQLTISSNSSAGSPAVVGLSGTGTAAAHNVALSWNAPVSSADPVAGYNIYRATGSGSFVLINSSPDVNVAYTDSGVTSGVAYSYQVTSVDFSGVESVPSNSITVTIP
jgi:proline racemase